MADSIRPCTKCGGERRAGHKHEWCHGCQSADQKARYHRMKHDPEWASRRAAQSRKYYLANRDEMWARNIWQKYRAKPEQYEAMLAAQNGGCAICGSPDPRNGRVRLHIDHDHTTGRLRGLLCSPCNNTLGLMGDDPARLRAAANYLEGNTHG